MANTILHKRSSTTGATPTGAQLAAGELALNTADSKVFLKNSSGTVVEVSYRDARVDSRVSTLLGSYTGNIIPSDDVTYSLGSLTKQWKDVFVGPGSLYVNGQKVLEESNGDIVVSCDINQNLVLNTTGTGDIELTPSGTGVISLKGPVQFLAGINITSSDGNGVHFATPVQSDNIISHTNNTDLTLSGRGTGKVYVNDNLETSGNLVVGGNLTVSGTTTTVNAETISLADNIIDLNSNFTTGTPTENAGLRILRGDEAAVQIRWNETSKVWQFTNDGATYGTIASSSGTETLTNKTIAAGSNTITGLTNTNLSGSAAISNANLANSSVTVGSTAISLGGTATTLAGLTSVTSTTFVGALSGNATTSSSTTGNAATVTNGVYTTDTGTVTNTMLAGSIANAKLTNSKVTVGTTDISLGASSTTLAGLTSVTSTSFVGALTGNASTATTAAALTTARTINGVSFDGSGNITITATATGALTIGTGLSGTSYNGSAGVTIAIDSTVATLTGSQTLTNKTLTAPNISALAITDSSIVFEGATADAYETTLTVVDPTADQTITLPDATGTVVLHNLAQTLTNKTINGSSNTITNVSLTSGVTGTLPVANGGTGVTTSTGTGSVVLSASPTFTGTLNAADISASGSLTVTGDLTVNGTTTTVNSTTVSIDDKNIELGSVATPTDVTANGGGVTLKGATDKTFNWLSATSAWTSSEHIALASGKNILLNGSSSGTTTLAASASASGTITLPAVTGTVVTTGDTGTVTNTMLAGSIATSKITGLATSATTDTTNAANITSGTLPNARLVSVPNSALANSSTTIGTTAISLGSSSTTLAGLTSVSSTGFTGALTGNASTATTLQTARAINGVNFDGSAAITVKASTTNALTIGTGLSGTSFDGSGAVTIANTGVTSNVAGTNISVSGATGAVTISTSATPTFTGITSGYTRPASNSATAYQVQNAAGTSILNVDSTNNRVGVNNTAPAVAFHVTGAGAFTGELTAYYSDKRLKENIKPIENALEKVTQLHGVTYNANSVAVGFGFTDTDEQVGLLAQDVQAVLPQVVVPAPFDLSVKDGKKVSKSGEDYITVKYEKIVALLVEAIKELNDKVESLEAQLGGGKSL